MTHHRAEYEALTSETFEVIEKLSNIDFSGFHKESTQTGGNYSMCRAMEEMLEDAREEARQEMCRAMEEMLEDAQEEGRQEAHKNIEELMKYAKNNGFEKLADKIARKLERFQIAGA